MNNIKQRTKNDHGVAVAVAAHFKPRKQSRLLTLTNTSRLRSTNGGDDDDKQTGEYNKQPPDEGIQINPVYLLLATAETIYWYWLAPGIDPTSRWFAPADSSFITDKLLNPSIVLSPPIGSGIGFSSLLLNSFLILPAVWTLLLLQERGDCTPGKRQLISPLPFCMSSFFVGGGALIPYMIVRRSRTQPGDIDPRKLPVLLKAFERRDPPIGPALLSGLLVVILSTFALPFLLQQSDLVVEWAAFSDRLTSSQFTSLALVDLTMISLAIIDPMIDDARRRGFLDDEDEGRLGATMRLVPFLFPLVGPVAWICVRPRYDV